MKKRLSIIVLSLIAVIGVSLAYFTVSSLISGNGSSVQGTTATIQGSTITVEGTLEFNDLDILPGHKNVSSIKITATGDNTLIPYNVIWNGENTLNTPLNYTAYKTSSEIEVTSSCNKITESIGTKIPDEFITSTSDGISIYYYVILEYPNLDESQNIDMGGSFNGEITIEESNVEPDINIIAAYIKQEDGTYEEVSDIPQDGYIINTEKSVCSNGATVRWDYANKELITSNLTKSGTSCYLYFDVSLCPEGANGCNTILANNPTVSDARAGAITGTLTTNTTGTIYTKQDDDGTSYFFAGNTTNNWVSFAGYYWRIIRINGDGSIRMIYNGTSTSTTGSGTQIQTSAYNSSYDDNAYVGYMYGSTGASSYSATHTNTNNSTIKGILDNWYRDHIVGEYEDYISKEAGFCNDRQTMSGVSSSYGTTGYGTNATSYAPWGRLYKNGSWLSSQTPTLECSQGKDLFTVGSSSKGNKELDYPIGLITSDEVVLGGGFGGSSRSSNSSYYLYTGEYYWTMSPSFFGSGRARVFNVNSDGSLSYYDVDGTDGVRPVLNLDAGVTLKSGNGTANSPFVV